MPMKRSSSRIILEVERAVGDLRRGHPVMLLQTGEAPVLLASGEHFPEEPAITSSAFPAVKLMKIAGLLPRAIIKPCSEEDKATCLSVSSAAIEAYPATLATSLEKVSEAAVPLAEAGQARFIAFRPRFGHEEHLAIVIGDIHAHTAPLVRVHSSCVTGDIFGSLRCDCGPQLHKALRLISEAGSGVILYLSQEGRGIGIANKLRAYQLQDEGMDTVDANLALGFAADERNFGLAASMLRLLDMPRITLLTNNPLKVQAISQFGIEVADRLPLTTPPTEQNNAYLETKMRRMGHLLPSSCCIDAYGESTCQK